MGQNQLHCTRFSGTLYLSNTIRSLIGKNPLRTIAHYWPHTFWTITRQIGRKLRSYIRLSYICFSFSSLAWIYNVYSMLCEPVEDFKVVRESFASATWILYGNWNIGTGSKRKCHGHSVVIVCIDRCYVQLLWWGDHAVIWPFLNCCSQLKIQIQWQC